MSHPSNQITIERAIEVFVHAFSRGKSQYHPYLAEQMEGLWVMRDGPGRKRPRKIEVIATDLDPETVVDRIARASLGWHFLCDVRSQSDDLEAINAQYRALGYRKVSTEWLFTHDLRDIPVFDSEPCVRQIDNLTQGWSGIRKVRPDARLYGAWDEDFDYGWVYSVPFGTDAWVSDLHVKEEWRRHGFGRALMSRMLQDDRELGVSHSVLLATSQGAKLYPQLGYEIRATLQMFCPLKRFETRGM